MKGVAGEKHRILQDDAHAPLDSVPAVVQGAESAHAGLL